MKMPSARVVLFNAAAILIAVAAVVAVLRSLLMPASLVPCSQRYRTSMVFPLERDGALVTATDIQARAGGRDTALVESLEIVRLAHGPASVAMSVALPKGSFAPHADAAEKGGVSFPWQPRALRHQSAVCLGYGVLLPADFNFNFGGALPGILGQSDQSGDGFLVQAAWRHGGGVGATARVALAGRQSRRQAEGDGAPIPRSRWVRLEQEVVLNEPGRENGIVRIWVDGALALDKAKLVYRHKADVGLVGVSADFFYSGDSALSRSPANAKVLISPFEIHWQ